MMFKELKTLVPYLKKYALRYGIGLLFLLLTDGSQLYIPQLIRQAIDVISSGSFSLDSIWPLAGQIAGLAVVIGLGRFLWRHFILGSARRIEQELRKKLFTHLLSLSSSFYGKIKTGDLMARFTNDLRVIRMAASMSLVAFIDGFFMTLAILTIMISQNARLALLSICPLPILTAGTYLIFGRLIGERFRRVQEGFSNLSDLTQESISGIRVLKTFVREKDFGRRFAEVNQDYSERNMALIRLWGLFQPAVTFLAGLTSLIFLLLGGRAVMEGALTPGEFTAFFAYLNMLIWPMIGAGFTVSLIQRAGASVGRLNRILEEAPDIANLPNAVRSEIRGAISIRHLTYSYPGSSQPVLSDLSLELSPGSTLGILGRTAAGKSTLVHLLSRILEPPEGMVRIDGRDVRSYDLQTLRAAISVVPQDGFLFSMSIRENIAFGGQNGDEDRIKSVAAISTIERDVANFPAGWDTVVGERGVTLSGGQKQRTALSRALAAEAAIYILDDSFSAVDTETEDYILRGLLNYTRDRTLILISHRISTLKVADQIVVMDQGRIIQQGTHDGLLGQEGFYAEIYRLQQLEEAFRKKG